MQRAIIDAHIHLDQYDTEEREQIIESLLDQTVKSVISVSSHLESAKQTLALAQKNEQIKPAFGYHPEQPLPKEDELEALFAFIKDHHQQMVAIGEVGLPYYLRRKNPKISREPYEELLECFIKQAIDYNKPLVLHAIYEDAEVVCDLLEKHSYQRAHFHWFKGSERTVKRMIENGYFISVTPDVVYETEIQQLVKQYPLSQMMAETDGPWPFSGPFEGQVTHPHLIHHAIQAIAEIKQLDSSIVYQTLYENTKQFYQL